MSMPPAGSHAAEGECREHSPAPARLGAAIQWLFAAAVAALFAWYLVAEGGRREALADIFTVFLSIVLEALPFMLIGSLAGGFIEVFVPREKLSAFLSKRKYLALFGAASLGIAFPVCECAIIPVVRRLLRKGVPFSSAVGYMLAGPLVNPIVAASTLVAYGGEIRVAAARLGGAFCIAVAVGALMGRLFRGESALAPMHEADHDDHDGCCCAEDLHGNGEGGSIPARILAALGHASDDFMDVGRFLVMGAFLAGVLRSQISEGAVLDALSGNAAGSIPVMMAFAVALNLCSEADAFVAASFRTVIPLSGQLAFMLMGPMFDLKLLMMYIGVFRRKAIVALAVSVTLAVFLACLLMELVLG